MLKYPRNISHALILNASNQVLCQFRKDTKSWAFPCGHLHLFEKSKDCAAREVKEENNLVLDANKLQFFNFAEKFNTNPNNQFHHISLFFKYVERIKDQKPIICEPHKCQEIKWFDLESYYNLKENELLDCNFEINQKYKTFYQFKQDVLKDII